MGTFRYSKGEIDSFLETLRKQLESSPDDFFISVGFGGGNVKSPSKKRDYYEFGSVIIASDAFPGEADGLEPLLKRTVICIIFKPEKAKVAVPEIQEFELLPKKAENKVE
jgi:hypothetical protein